MVLYKIKNLMSVQLRLTIGFWSNIQKTDKYLYKASVKYQKNYRKLKKAELDLKFWTGVKVMKYILNLRSGSITNG